MVLGSTGLLGQALMKLLKSRNQTVVGIARKNADISIDITDEQLLRKALENNKPDVIINTVAIVNLSLCEENSEQCYVVNARPSAMLAKYTALNKIKYVYISTDHYFTGDQDKKHSETAPLTLTNQYAITKQLGEEFSLNDEDALVVRTNIVGFRGDKDAPTFIEWAINALKNNEEMQLFDDFYTSSIDVMSFSEFLFDLIEKNTSGIINLASSEVSNKQKFITALASRLNLSTEYTMACSMMQNSSAIDRNESLGLDVSKAEEILGCSMPSLDQVIEKLAKEYQNKE